MTEEYGVSIGFIAAMMIVGFWLEGINGKNGLLDHFLTPFPLGITAMIVLVERSFA